MQMVAFRRRRRRTRRRRRRRRGWWRRRAGSSAINLSWTASTDNVGVTGYRVERCQGAGCSSFAQVGTPTGTTFADSGLLASTSYSYRVRATDAAGNLSGYSNVASATTAAGSGHDAADGPKRAHGDRHQHKSDQPELDGVHRQRRRGVLSSIAMPANRHGGGLPELRASRPAGGARDHVQRCERTPAGYYLSLHCAGPRRCRQCEHAVQRGERDDGGGEFGLGGRIFLRRG